jgi:choline-sulfatase
VTEHASPALSVRDAIHFTYDDHQAGTALTDAPGQPNRIRAIRTPNAKYAFYFDPNGQKPTEYELYDLERDALEVENLMGVRSGEPHDNSAATLRSELAERLDGAMDECVTAPDIKRRPQTPPPD